MLTDEQKEIAMQAWKDSHSIYAVVEAVLDNHFQPHQAQNMNREQASRIAKLGAPLTDEEWDTYCFGFVTPDGERMVVARQDVDAILEARRDATQQQGKR